MTTLGVATLGSDFDPSGLESGLSAAQGTTQRFLSGWQAAFSAAAGFIIRDVIMAIGRSIVNLGKQAMEATAEWERMGLSMQSLVARELRAADSTLTMSDALEKAGVRTQELLGWVQKLAIQSPFNAAGIQTAFQTALTYGFTSKAAQRLTQNMVDFAAATGKGVPDMGRVALALGQIKQVGHLAGTEMRQLTEAGVPVIDILASMGKNLDDVSNKTVDANAFIEAFSQSIEHDFGGAAARQTNTWAGLINSFDDLKKIGLRTLFKGIFDQLQPLAAKFAEWLQGPGMIMLENMGKWIGNAAAGLFDMIGAIDRLQYFFGNLDKGMSTAGALHRLFPKLNLDGAVSKKFIEFLDGSLGFIRQIIDGIDEIKNKLMAAAGRVKFFFDNLQKGMSFQGALQRLVPDIDLSKLGGIVKDALYKVFTTGAGAAGVAGAGYLIGNTLVTGIGKFFSAGGGTQILNVAKAIGGNILMGIGKFFASGALAEAGTMIFTAIMASPIGSGVTMAFVNIFSGIAPLFAGLAPIFTGLAATVGAALSSIITFLAPILLIVGAVMLLAGAFQMFQRGQLAQPIADIQAAFAQMGAVFMSLMPLIQQLGSQIWEGFLTSSRELAAQVIPWLVGQIQKIADWFTANRPLIERFFTAIAGFITNNLLPAIVGMWQFVGPILTGLIDLILGIARVIMQVATGDWSGAWATILATVQAVGAQIGTAVYGFLNWIANIFGSSLGEIQTIFVNNWNQLVQIVTTMAGMIWQGFQQGIDAGLDPFTAFISSVLASIIRVVMAIFGIASPSTVFMDIGVNLILGLINGINSMIGAVGALLVNIANLFIMGWNIILTNTQMLLATIFAFIVFTFQSWLIYFTNIWLTITTITNAAWVMIQAIIWGALTMLSAIILGFAKPIADSIQSVFTQAIAKATTLAAGFTSAGKAIIDGILSGLSSGAGAVIEAVKKVIADAVAAAMAALDANSPSKVFMEIGSFVPAGMSIGIADNVGQAVATVKNASMEIGMAMVPNQMAPGYQPGSFAATPVQNQLGTSSNATQIGPFYGTVNVGKMEDLGHPDPLETAKVQ